MKLFKTGKDMEKIACLNLDYGTTKYSNQKWEGCKDGGIFIKTSDQYPHWFMFGHFFSSLVAL